MEKVFICSVGIYRCEKSSSIKINMNMTQNFDMLHVGESGACPHTGVCPHVSVYYNKALPGE